MSLQAGESKGSKQGTPGGTLQQVQAWLVQAWLQNSLLISETGTKMRRRQPATPDGFPKEGLFAIPIEGCVGIRKPAKETPCKQSGIYCSYQQT